MAGSTLAGTTLASTGTLSSTSVTVNHGLGGVTDTLAHSGVGAGPPTPRRVGHGPALPRGARRIGVLADSTRINVDVVLAPSSAVALQDYAANVSSPGNPLYHHYLTPDQFTAMFGATASAVSTVEASLRADGLTPGPLSANHLTLPVTATAKQFAGAFSLGFDRYQLSGGRVAFANTTAPLFPGAAAQYVSAVVGLDTLSTPQPIGPSQIAKRLATGASPHVVTGGPQPCSTIAGPAASAGVYTADQLASAYNFSGLYQAGDEGAGVTVALVEFEPNLTSDISAYQACYNTDTTVNYVPVDGGAGSGPGGGEAAADIEDIIGLAPKATIDVYQAPQATANGITETELLDEYNAVMHSGAQVISTSWGTCEAGIDSQLVIAENTIFEEAATQGQSVFAASGDDGSTDCGTSALSVDDPGSQPYVTSVGGTDLTSTSPAAQTAWNANPTSTLPGGAGGGGISAFNPMPAYQSSAPAALNVINSGSSGSPCAAGSGSYCREVPDVSANAELEHGYVIYYDGVDVNGGWAVAGGTSLAAPLWAAFAALTDASSTCAGKAIGFANPLLYRAAATNYAADFSDITSGNNDYTPDGYTGGLYPAGTGYDMATGLGTPNGATLAQALCNKGGASNTVTVTSLINQVTTVGATVSLPITAADSGGASLTFSATGLPPGLSISPSGLISGSPTAAGTYSVTVTATDTTGASGSTTFTMTVNQASQSISFTPPATGTVGGSATLTATGGGSGNPVVFSVDTTSGSGVCTVSGTTVSYLAAGSCVIDANQAGNASYTAAPQVTLTVTVGQAS
ncbi:MAG TPA: protease pro-enzyme activation domain-containing protein, partial [Trebonia sp.]|nr:protease pro-enzyme activation domain-containing protein [Trebonia sp.]